MLCFPTWSLIKCFDWCYSLTCIEDQRVLYACKNRMPRCSKGEKVEENISSYWDFLGNGSLAMSTRYVSCSLLSTRPNNISAQLHTKDICSFWGGRIFFSTKTRLLPTILCGNFLFDKLFLLKVFSFFLLNPQQCVSVIMLKWQLVSSTSVWGLRWQHRSFFPFLS